jgi:hypothetical protein
VRLLFAFILLLSFATATHSGAEEPVVKPKPQQKEDKKDELPPVRLPTDVPVTGGGTNKPQEPAQSSTIPINFVRNRVENIKVSSFSYVSVEAIRVDSKRRCWLNPYALTGIKANDRPIQVKRDAVGFHVILEEVDHQWEAVDIDTKGATWLPVNTVAVR